ncbi:MAG: hypothetical protein JNL69_03780, partial [Bacteroidia bacterium]|nr:hypothetical protein [Bacteroidia bacterium]
MKKVYSLLFSLLFFCSLLNAQSIANYSTTRTTGILYNSINSTGIAIDSWRNNGGFSQDDNRSVATDIGFDFWYNGTRYTQFSVSTNGFVDFSSSTADGGPVAGPYGYDNAQFTGNGSGTWLALAPFYDDMTASGGVDALGNSIKYLVTGTAPARVLTIEWINMAVYLNTTPSLNFQVKLYETTGVIEFVYGTMTQGTANFTYTCGINAATLANTPTAAQLKCQQTANSNTFNNTEQNALTAMPTNNSKITFTPTVTAPASPSGTLTFAGVSQTGMTLSWTNWCTNEVGYVIYNSTDNVNFSFVTQTAANATNSAISGLMPGTTYYWRLYAVTDGFLSASINGTQATNAAGNKFSTGTGNWNVAGTWTPAGVPTAADNVTIRNGHTVSINVNAVCNNLTIGEGTSGTLRYTGGTNLTLNVSSNLLVNAGATFNIANNATHTLNLNGNLINNGTVDFRFNANRVCNVNFIKNGNAILGGTGATNRYNLITLNMGTSINNTLDVTATNFTVQNNFLTLTNGSFKLSTVSALTLTPFTALATINNTSGFIANSSTAIVNFPAGVSLYGNLIVNLGAVNIGDAANENIVSNGGVFQIFGGTVNVAGQYYSSNINTLSKFTISGGTLTVPSVGCTSTTIAPFQIDGAGSTFNMSGGTIIIPREGGNGAQDLGYTVLNVSNSAVTGGTLQIGSTTTPVAQIININSSARVGNLTINSANATARLNTNSLTVTNNIMINSGTLNANNLNLTLGGNWLDVGTFTPGTGTVTFNGGNQTITKTTGETFNNLVLAGNNTKTLGGAVATNNVTINSGSTFDISASNYAVNIRGNYTNNGMFNTRAGTITFNGTTLQSIGGTSVTSFNNIVLNNNAGAGLSSAQNLINTLTLTNGTFATNNQGFTLISNASRTARIATIPATANITGDVTMQRYVPAGTDGWMFLCTPVSGATLQQWDDDFITGGFPGSAYPYPIVTNASIVSYNETLPGIYDDGYVEPTNITNPITPNKGYWAYIMNTPVTIDVTGPVLKNTINFGVTYT